MIYETAQLLETIQGMEFEHPQGPGAITEFDRVFQIGCKAIVHSLVASSADWRSRATARPSSLSTTNSSPFWNRPPRPFCAAGWPTAGA